MERLNKKTQKTTCRLRKDNFLIKVCLTIYQQTHFVKIFTTSPALTSLAHPWSHWHLRCLHFITWYAAFTEISFRIKVWKYKVSLVVDVRDWIAVVYFCSVSFVLLHWHFLFLFFSYVFLNCLFNSFVNWKHFLICIERLSFFLRWLFAHLVQDFDSLPTNQGENIERALRYWLNTFPVTVLYYHTKFSNKWN